LTGGIHRIDAATGEVLSTLSTDSLPDRVIYKACGNRRAGSCPSCAETYRRDAFHIIRSGLVGGKGVSPAVATHPAVFAPCTAASASSPANAACPPGAPTAKAAAAACR